MFSISHFIFRVRLPFPRFPSVFRDHGFLGALYIYIYISIGRALHTGSRNKNNIGAATPCTRITCELFSKQKNHVCVHTHTHVHTHNPLKNILYTHVAVDTNIVVFRPSEPRQYSINIFTQVYTLVHTHTHKHQYHNSMSILCVFTHMCKLSQIHTSIHSGGCRNFERGASCGGSRGILRRGKF